ncbi:MAG: UDP-N-acetylmuramoyl-tripeptide--D-alanyl-D-alanine ligase [Xanthomonadales bacterium]|nr:UDP-N-acetylmuramoyl-tripeptide--D-alanyl-D-alanine ligase [Xanthomonadales bacterium]
MITLSLAEAAQIVSGQLLDVDTAAAATDFCGVVIDSRQVRKAQLFAALPGEHTDGHEYVALVLSQGAAVALVATPVENAGAQIVVKDVQLALGELAASWLARLRAEGNLTVIALTGSNGKTTVKEMLGSVLSLQHKVLMTQGNFNNELGLPLTLFALDSDDEYAILELGASRAGDIAYLCEICKPDIALLNNVGPAHLEGFGDLQGVALAKGEIFAGLLSGGCAIVNADEPWMALWQSQIANAKTFSFGSKSTADVWADLSTEQFNLNTGVGQINDLILPLPGQHNRMNALAATAVLQALTISLTEIRQGLERVSAATGRLQSSRAPGGWQVIDDTYNANPASLYAGIAVLTEGLSVDDTAWLILGDMAELGEDGPQLHKEMGAAARSAGISRLYALGEQTKFSVAGFGKNACHYANKADLLDKLLADIHPRVTCLVKGSRSMGMEEVANALLQEPTAWNAANHPRETV